MMQTAYAELLERCETAAFDASFPEDGVFTPKAVKGRRYWYFQSPSAEGRQQKYVGPETPELLERIARHKHRRNDERERRALVATLVRSFRLPRPKPSIGNVIEALAKAGIFRLRAVLVGTAAYQTYPAMLGVTLPGPSLQTDDIDVAQFEDVSVAVSDRTPSAIDVLKNIDKTFRPIPTIHKGRVTNYVADDGLRVEFLTPNRGPSGDSPKHLPALQTDAKPLRFLDFLIYQPERAVILHGAGILVLVPSPERYAVHKLIISQRPERNAFKRDKDIQQAEALLNILAAKRAYELNEVWNEAFQRWRKQLAQGMGKLSSSTRDIILKTANKPRSVLPGMALAFDDRPATYDSTREAVVFHGRAMAESVTCMISRAALDDHFGTDHLDKEGRLDTFREKRSLIEGMARTKYLFWEIEEPDQVLIKTSDVRKLLPKRKP